MILTINSMVFFKFISLILTGYNHTMSNDHSISSKFLFERAKQSIPGGVNSPVRAFKAVGGTPLFIKSAKGAFITDSEGKSYIDYIQSWGPMIMGHAHRSIINAVKKKH